MENLELASPFDELTTELLERILRLAYSSEGHACRAAPLVCRAWRAACVRVAQSAHPWPTPLAVVCSQTASLLVLDVARRSAVEPALLATHSFLQGGDTDEDGPWPTYVCRLTPLGQQHPQLAVSEYKRGLHVFDVALTPARVTVARVFQTALVRACGAVNRS